MLKLEKIAKTLEISITLRKRERIFNKVFIQALLIALGIHLCAIGLFTIRLAKITGSQLIFPPVLVESDISTLPENSVVAQLDSDELLPRHVKEPKGSKPELPPLTAKAVSDKKLHLNKVCCCYIDSFQGQEDLASPFDLLSAGNKAMPDSVRFVASGMIDEQIIQTAGLENLDLSALGKVAEGCYRRDYNVRIDNKTGCVFWYEPERQFQDDSLDSLFEFILKNMRFQIKDDPFISAGTIEIILNGRGHKR